jgi:DNA polymerase-3 subunit beta
MKFIVSSSTLLKNLQHISGVISSNTVLPILEDFLFEVDENQLTIMATDLETIMKVKLEVQAKSSGRVCIPAKIMIDYLKNLPEQPLTYDINVNDYSIDITSDQGKYKIVGESAENFPKEPVADESTSFIMPASALNEGINKTIFAVSGDDLRPAMTGVYFELNPGDITLVATDAHRLVKFSRNDISCPKQDSFIVPRKPLQQLKSALPSDGTPVRLAYNNNFLFVESGNLTLSCRLIEARFPDYKVVIPPDNPYLLTVNRADFVSALKRVSVFANKTTNQVALSIKGNELQLNAQDVDFSFEGSERMSCMYNGQDMQIAFNAKLLVEMANALDSGEVNVELSTPTKAGILKPVEKEENEDVLMLLMPLMINN